MKITDKDHLQRINAIVFAREVKAFLEARLPIAGQEISAASGSVSARFNLAELRISADLLDDPVGGGAVRVGVNIAASGTLSLNNLERHVRDLQLLHRLGVEIVTIYAGKLVTIEEVAS